MNFRLFRENTFLLLFFKAVLANAQSSDLNLIRNNLVTFPSPKAWAFSNYGDYPVSLYTGSIDISVDLFKIKDFDSEINVKLSYNPMEVKPSVFPSEVGLGFSIQAGGIISRTLKSLPDDDVKGFYFNGGNQDLYFSSRDSYLTQVLNRNLDPEPDMFNFRFLNYSGSFYFDKNKNVVLSEFSNLKITPITDLYSFKGFEVLTPDGTKLYFYEKSLSTYLGSNSMRDYFTSAWYLSKIEYSNKQQVNFEYYPNSLEGSGSNYFSTYSKSETQGVLTGLVPNSIVEKNTHISLHYDKYLKAISFSAGKIDFEMSNRLDRGASRTKKIDKIKLYDKVGNFLYGYNFDYFENQQERLKLKNIYRTYGTTNELYRSFEYSGPFLPWNSDNNYPYYSEEVDFWGFYNGKTQNQYAKSLIPESYLEGKLYGDMKRESDGNAVIAEVLRKIIYPSGGYTEFIFELNDFSNQGMSYSPKKRYITSAKSYLMEYDSGQFSEDPYSIEFTLAKETNVKVFKNIKGGGPNTRWIANPSTTYEQYSLTLSPRTYNLGSILNANYLLHPDNSDVVMASGGITYDYTVTEDLSGSNVEKGGGIRIAKVINHNGMTSTSRKYVYKNNLGDLSSSGRLTRMPTYAINTQSLIPNLQGFFTSSTPILAYDESEVVGYSSVFEVNEDGSFSKFTYTGIVDFPDVSNDFELRGADALLSPNTSRRHLRGKVLREEIYDSNKNLLKDVEYKYTLIEDNRSKTINYVLVQPTFPILANRAGGESYFDMLSATMNSVYTRDFSFMRLRQKDVKTYSANTGTSYSEQFFYDNPLHPNYSRRIYLDSRQKEYINYITYPLDYSSGFSSHIAKNIVNIPVENVTTIKMDGKEQVVSGIIKEYFDSGKENKIYTLDINKGLTDFKFSNRPVNLFPPLGVTGTYEKDAQYKLLRTINLYDMFNNPVQSCVNNDINTSYLWGYSGQYPIMEIKNATYAQVDSVLTKAAIDNLNVSTHSQATMESLIKSAAGKLRAGLPNAMVTTYTYKPLVGMTSKTDPRGITEYYKYDGMQRLQAILDHLNHVNRAFDYHYRPN
ncbi:hypothetical protein [Sphingobacterium thalpophilum]|uniref:hypothetical protein n=1 Tax=Sphingobacterium thalpophilum TaxID=259 RepID=UPI0031DC928F